jgi:hypothetical protein
VVGGESVDPASEVDRELSEFVDGQRVELDGGEFADS